jgi:plasmid maintenance system antidote protein VapI
MQFCGYPGMHLSAKMAQRFGRYFGNGPEFRPELQMRHDLVVAAREVDLRKIMLIRKR